MLRSTVARPFVTFEDDEDRFLPEGPRAVTVDGRPAVAWVNIQTAVNAKRGAVHLRFWDNGEQNLWNLSGRPGFVLPTDKPNVLFVGMEKQLGLLELETNEFQPLATIPDDNPRTIINDGEVVPGGHAVVFGTKDLLFQDPIAHLYLFTLDDAKVTVLADRQICSNGKIMHADDNGLLLYDIDSPTRTIARYRFDLTARQAIPDGTAVDLRQHSAVPDGLHAVGDGTAIVAFYDPAAVPHGQAIRYDLRTGEPIEEWTTPGAPRVTCPLLAKQQDGVKLILTTATEGMPADDLAKCPESGNLFMADTSLTEMPAEEVVRLPK